MTTTERILLTLILAAVVTSLFTLAGIRADIRSIQQAVREAQ
jgi:predicted small secreted protein